MDEKCVYLLFFSFFILFIPTNNYQGSLKFRDLKIPVESKDLGHIVAKSLMKQYHNRKMIDVSNFYYNLHMAWRGVSTFFWRKMLKFFCSPLAREAKIGRKLKKQLLEKHNIEEQLDSAEPSYSYQKKNSSKKDEKSDEVSDEKSSEEDSDEKVKEKKDSSKSSKRRDNLDTLFK